jgi:NAD(P)H-nitrite reductase large subunit
MTTGAAQTLQRAYRVAPGRRVVIGANGPLNFQVAADLVASGIEVVALVETAARPGPQQLGAALQALRAAPGLMRDGIRYLARLKRAGVALHYGSAIIAAEGRERVEGVTIARVDGAGTPIAGSETSLKADAVCVGHGFLPSNEMARALGCRHRYDPAKACLVPVIDDEGRSTLPEVYIVGDGGGMGGARAAQEQGFIAGCAAAAAIGKPPPPDVAAELARRRAALQRHRAFQAALWAMFAAPPLGLQAATADTILCRCENVSLGTIRDRLAEGAVTVSGIKRQTRAGMGRCQGRYCSALVAALLPAAPDSGAPDRGAPGSGAIDELTFLAPRPPSKPVRLADVARRPA